MLIWRRPKDLGERAWILLAALGIGLALAAGVRAEEAGSSSVTELQARIEELTRRVHGMEGKLRDSAAARKTADQARMEAERRLAEGTQEVGRQSAEIALLRDAKLALEARLERAEQEASKSAETLAAAEEAARRLTVERDGEAQRAADLERRLDQLQGQQPRAEAAEAELERLKSEVNAAEAERNTLRNRLDRLRTTLPSAVGGSLTVAEAQANAAAAAVALRDAIARANGAPSGQDRRAVRDAERVLHRRQFMVAWVAGARSVYRVRPSDSLALIASRFYGDSGRWKDIHEANRAVAPNPDQLTAGITLVIP